MNIVSENVNKDLSKDEQKFKSMLINEKTFETNSRVEGIALLRAVKEATTSTGSPMVKFTFQGAGGGSFQANIFLNYLETATASLYEAVGKLVKISGVVNKFNNVLLLNLDDNPIVFNDIDIKLSDFFLETQNLKEYMNYITEYLDSKATIDYYMKTWVEQIHQLNMIKLLSTSVLDMNVTYKGDALKLVVNILKDIENIDIECKNYIGLLTILYFGLEQWYFNLSVSSKKILTTIEIDKMKKIFDLINKIYIPTFVNYKVEEELEHVYSVFNFNKNPKTLTANILTILYKKNFDLINVENIFSVIRDNSVKVIDNKEYLKL